MNKSGFEEKIKLFLKTGFFIDNYNLNNINDLYRNIAIYELKLRKELNGIDFMDCLNDSIMTCKIILSKGIDDKEKYEKLLNGIIGFSNFINEDFSLVNTFEYATNVYIFCLIVKCGDISIYQEYVADTRNDRISRSFISKTFRELRNVLNEDYIRLEEAIKVENKYFELIRV